MVLKRLEQKNMKIIEEVISHAGTVIADETKKKEWINFTVRIRKDLLSQIEAVLEHRLGITKTAWILEAIQEKLKRHSC